MEKAYNNHNCLQNWKGTPRLIEADGAVFLHRKIIEKINNYLYICIKDNDGPITASISPRLMTKEEYDTKKYYLFRVLSDKT